MLVADLLMSVLMAELALMAEVSLMAAMSRYEQQTSAAPLLMSSPLESVKVKVVARTWTVRTRLQPPVGAPLLWCGAKGGDGNVTTRGGKLRRGERVSHDDDDDHDVDDDDDRSVMDGGGGVAWISLTGREEGQEPPASVSVLSRVPLPNWSLMPRPRWPL